MQFTSYNTQNGTVVKLEDTPEDKLLYVLADFINDRGGLFLDSQHKEFFLKKRLEPEEIEKIFSLVNIPITHKKEEFGHIKDPKARKKLIEESKTPVLSFGIYKGKKITAVPKNYLTWIVDNHADKELIKACSEEIKTRSTVKIF